jgi:hypothetical protein
MTHSLEASNVAKWYDISQKKMMRNIQQIPVAHRVDEEDMTGDGG